MAAFKVLETQFQMFIKSWIYLDDEYVVMTYNYFLQYTQLEIPKFHNTLIQHMEYVNNLIDERAQHKQEYYRWMNERQMQITEEKVDTSKALDASLVDTKSSGTESKEQHTSSRSGNDVHADDADIRPIYDEEPMAKEIYFLAVKPHHVITSSESRNSSKNMPRFSSNDMVHNHYLEEAKKKTQERGRNSRPSVIPFARSQSTTNGSKPKPRSNTQTSRNWPTSKSSFKCVFYANHDSCVKKFLNEVNSRAKVPSTKTTNKNKPEEQISVAKKPERHIPKGHGFSIKNTSVVHEKIMTPRSCLRWKSTSKIFKTVGLRWVPTGKIFASSTTKVDSEPINSSDEDIINNYEYEQTLDVSVGTLNLSESTSFNPKKEGHGVWLL
uniref:Integrase, catalytic region, zinc finger, CCHC-type, peptidase aspartic, catalytic n=1 Tax=Tanacetum cinerariifolium TaxID=118510 RepID=A0A6L2KEJ5_TANCI|nr:hypothetical protein [Tanacetum cinerariifolium]